MTQQLTSIAPDTAVLGPPGPGDGTAWWRDAVIYQVYVRSFADSDGDGIGDLRGAQERLDHLAELGVDAVWLTPFYSSPQADGGYDVADYRTVDPLFGDLDDAEAFVRRAHELGLRVILDIVPNHTSDRHPWFTDPDLARRRYIFRPGKGESGRLPPNDWESVFGGPAWTRTDRGDWYLHLFAPQQPDLDWERPEVRAEFESVLRFWLDLGVDGFRIDVAHGMVKAIGLPDIGHKEQTKLIGRQVLPFFDQDGVHAIHRSWRRLLDSYEGERIGVAEAWAPSAERLALYVRPDELHQAFNFHFLAAPWDAAALREVIDESLAATAAVGAPTTWVLSNHDVVRHPTRLGGLARARAATLLMLALPGSSYLYQGEELGLPEVLDLPDEVRQDPAFFRGDGQEGARDGCRVPLPWSGDTAPYGFGPGGSWLPQPRCWRELSAAAQRGDPSSTLELYRTALALRRSHPALGAGHTVEWLGAADGVPEGVLAFRRRAADGSGFVCAANTTTEAVQLPRFGRLLVTSRGASATDGATEETTEGAAEDATEGITGGVTEDATEAAIEGAIEGDVEGVTDGMPPSAPPRPPRNAPTVSVPGDTCAWWAI